MFLDQLKPVVANPVRHTTGCTVCNFFKGRGDIKLWSTVILANVLIILVNCLFAMCFAHPYDTLMCLITKLYCRYYYFG